MARDKKVFKLRGWNLPDRHAPYNFPQQLEKEEKAGHVKAPLSQPARAADSIDDGDNGDDDNDDDDDNDNDDDDNDDDDMGESGDGRQGQEQEEGDGNAAVGPSSPLSGHKRKASPAPAAGSASATGASSLSPSTSQLQQPQGQYIGVFERPQTAGALRFRVSRYLSSYSCGRGSFFACRPPVYNISCSFTTATNRSLLCSSVCRQKPVLTARGRNRALLRQMRRRPGSVTC